MEDREKTNEQLIQEVEQLRARIAALETLTDEKAQAEEFLRGSLTLARNAIEASPEATVVVDRDCRVVLANRAATEMIGGDDPASKCLTCYRAFHGREAPCDELGERPLLRRGSVAHARTISRPHRER